MGLLVVSPHLDDAVFSCGDLIATHQTKIVTICAGIPAETLPPSHFDALMGFNSAANAIRGRRAEDAHAAAVLGAEVVHLPIRDSQYGGGDIAAGVKAALSLAESDDVLLGPLGLRHPDHCAVADAFIAQARAMPNPVSLYEELPYSVLWPEFIDDAVRRAGADMAIPFRESATSLKVRAMRCYGSQLIGMDTAPLLKAERYRRLSGEPV